MFTPEIFHVALDALRANKFRAFLTMLGVMIGSACIVLVVTVALTGKRYIMAQIEGVGTNIVYAKLVRAGPQGITPLIDEISASDMEAVRNLARVNEVAGTRSMMTTVVVEGIERPVSMVGVTEGFQRIRNLIVVRGRFLDADDMRMRNKVCVLTEELAELAFPSQDPIGKVLRVGELRFTVVGVFRERVSTFGQSEIQRETLVIPFPLLKYYSGTDYLSVLYAQAATPEDVTLVTRGVADVLERRHRPEAVYQVQNLRSLLEAAGNISLALSIVLLVVGLIALTISGIGIMNIMLVTVTERTKEIGLRMSIGAHRRQILYQFLMEALIISGSGAVAGIAIAVSLPILAQPFLPRQLSVPISWVSVVLSFVVTCLTGILFGYLPASRAAKLQPSESLRYE
ncbi:MAG TPA: ABC transporter permease [Terriglobales bacterium]|nr:ABC transporter permease [Terriglobales bacterium]